MAEIASVVAMAGGAMAIAVIALAGVEYAASECIGAGGGAKAGVVAEMASVVARAGWMLAIAVMALAGVG